MDQQPVGPCRPTFDSILEKRREDGTQWVGDALHNLGEAAWQDTQQVGRGWDVLLDAVVVVVEASLAIKAARR